MYCSMLIEVPSEEYHRLEVAAHEELLAVNELVARHVERLAYRYPALVAPPMEMPVDCPTDRWLAFWKKVKVTGYGCWEWMGALNATGYGQFSKDGIPRLAHRVLYEWINGPIDPGMTLDHLCCNASCIRPDHLEVVTLEENCRRGGVVKRWGDPKEAKEKREPRPPKVMRARDEDGHVTHCIHGHEYTEANTYVNKHNGAKVCRTCLKMRSAKWSREHPEYRRKWRKEHC
jgi:hypothetical protein